MTEFPEHAWKPWKFQASVTDWWRSLAELVNQLEPDPVAITIAREFIESIHSPEWHQHQHSSINLGEDRSLRWQKVLAEASTINDLPSLDLTTATRLAVFAPPIGSLRTRSYMGLVSLLRRTRPDLLLTVPAELETVASSPIRHQLATIDWKDKAQRREYLMEVQRQLLVSEEQPDMDWKVLYKFNKEVAKRTGGTSLIGGGFSNATFLTYFKLLRNATIAYVFLFSGDGSDE